MTAAAVKATVDAALRELILARHGAAFGVNDNGWTAWTQVGGAQLGAADVVLCDGEADAALLSRIDTAGAIAIESEREGGCWVDTVRSPMGTWVFSVRAGDDTAHSPAFTAVLLACLALHFPAHDALCLARAWQAGSSEWPTDFARFPQVRHVALVSPGQEAQAFPACPPLGLYAVVPTAAWVEQLVPLGVPTVQLRFKSADAQAVRAEIARAADAARGSNARLFINDHWREAIALHASFGNDSAQSGIYGIHLGQEDLDEADLPALRASGLHLGVSTHGYAEMLRVAAIGPSYLALGAIFPTTTKIMPTAPQGMGRFQAYATLMNPVMPSLVGIGGVDAARLPDVLAAGVGSAAVVRAITEAADVPAAVAHLLGLFPAV